MHGLHEPAPGVLARRSGLRRLVETGSGRPCQLFLTARLTFQVVWAVGWMLRNYRKDFYTCLMLIAYDIFVVSSGPLFRQYLFETALPRCAKQAIP